VRIATRLRISAAATAAALVTVVPVLYWAFLDFNSAKSDADLFVAIKLNFVERISLKDQYFLYPEERVRLLWEDSKKASGQLFQTVKIRLDGEREKQALERLENAIEGADSVFGRIVNNTENLTSTTGSLAVFQEFDKRLYSQMLLKATSARRAISDLEDSAAKRVELAYRRLALTSGLLALILALVIVLNALQITRLISRRLLALHGGAGLVARGDLGHRIDTDGNDEFSELARSINAMTEELQVLTTDLEAKVRERTAELVQSESHLRAVIEAEPECIHIVDAQGRVAQMNPAGLAMFQADAPSDVVGRHLSTLLAPEYRAAFAAMHQRVLVGESAQLEFEVIGLKGRRRWLETHAAPMAGRDQNVQLAVTRDITERKQSEAQLKLAASVFTFAREGIMITDPTGKIVDVNDAFTRITGYCRDDVLGRTPRILSSGRHDATFYAEMWRSLLADGHWSGEVWNRRQNGVLFPEMQTISAVRDALGRTVQYVALFSDITALKEHQSQLERIVHFDALTNLPNRVLLADRLQQAMAQSQRRDKKVAVVFLDLDGFKAVNDLHGHHVGDELLITLAAGMKQVLRDGDTLARIGGDEFVAVLIDLPDAQAPEPLLGRLLAAAAKPVAVGDVTVQVSASLGVAIYPQGPTVYADQLLRQADHAMYQAKLAGKNRFHVFDSKQDSTARSHHQGVDRIRLALEQREFVLHYQPKVNMRTGQVIGAEALIRWQHPERGLLAPAEFLPLVEDHPLSVSIGEWVIDNALTQVERWRVAGLDLPVSVNIGARQLQHPDFCERLRASLAAHPAVEASYLELEVLETNALADLAQVSQVIADCAQIGVEFALDDFGTGYSALTYLKSLRVATLKIDQSFVIGMLDDPDDRLILEGVIGLARAFKCQVVAEGVETVPHGSFLLQMGCELAQGYGIARPMPADAVPNWANAWKAPAAWSSFSRQRALDARGAWEIDVVRLDTGEIHADACPADHLPG
jgi:diguanylate cyclase (GGDEF)-like protein/PAS domain S-box-containing protein